MEISAWCQDTLFEVKVDRTGEALLHPVDFPAGCGFHIGQPKSAEWES